MSRSSLNRPAGAINPPQHLFDEQVPVAERSLGAGAVPAAAPAREPATPADPHPAEEEHPSLAPHPGGVNPPVNSPEGDHDMGPNPALHDGTAPPRPHNAGSGPE